MYRGRSVQEARETEGDERGMESNRTILSKYVEE